MRQLCRACCRPSGMAPETPDSAIVTALLRQAEAARASDGLVLLGDAIPFIDKASSRSEFPSQYGGGKWNQLIRRCGAFESEERTRCRIERGPRRHFGSRPSPT